MTLIVAGRHLDRAGVLRAPGREGCLRLMGGFLQLTGSPLVVSPPFPLLANDDGPATIVIRVRAGICGRVLPLTWTATNRPR